MLATNCSCSCHSMKDPSNSSLSPLNTGRDGTCCASRAWDNTVACFLVLTWTSLEWHRLHGCWKSAIGLDIVGTSVAAGAGVWSVSDGLDKFLLCPAASSCGNNLDLHASHLMCSNFKAWCLSNLLSYLAWDASSWPAIRLPQSPVASVALGYPPNHAVWWLSVHPLPGYPVMPGCTVLSTAPSLQLGPSPWLHSFCFGSHHGCLRS